MASRCHLERNAVSRAILRAIEIPPIGGDTLFVDANAAYEGLTQEMKDEIDSLNAVHDFLRAFGRQVPKESLLRCEKCIH